MAFTDTRPLALTGVAPSALRGSDARIVVTGASGWLGHATLELLAAALGSSFDGRVVAFASAARDLPLLDGRRVPVRPLAAIGELDRRPSLVLHLAFLTKDRARELDEAAYLAANRQISTAVLTALDRIGATGVFVASSGAARWADDPSADPALSLYGAAKRADEIQFAEWARAAGADAVITRVFNISGPWINKTDSYALSSFISAALDRRPIEIRATRRVVRSYVSISELMSVVLGRLAEPPGGRVDAFDTGSDLVLELTELAEAVQRALGRHDGVARPPVSDAQPDIYVGDKTIYSELKRILGVVNVGFTDQILETASFLARAI